MTPVQSDVYQLERHYWQTGLVVVSAVQQNVCSETVANFLLSKKFKFQTGHFHKLVVYHITNPTIDPVCTKCHLSDNTGL